VVFGIDLNEPSVLIEQRSGLKELQTKQTEMACDAKVEVTAGL